VPNSTARKTSLVPGPSRAGKSCGMAALILLLGCQGLQSAAADGDTRTLSMHHIHTDENITITYKRDGRYDEAALKQLNWFLRDWRRQEEISMDPHLLDLVWEVSREVNTHKPIEVVCGYRSPQTNAMLRRRSGGVARLSQHMHGRAMDFFIPDAPLEELRIAGLRLQRGGVGFYPTSGTPFVHLDTGSVRHWPRMTREQLVRVFPDGRTVHVPSDGRPLAGYALALADIEKRGNSPSPMSLEAARAAGVPIADKPRHNLLAALFGQHTDEDEDGDSAAASSNPAPGPHRQNSAMADSKPAPAAPSGATYQLAAAPPLAPAFTPAQLAQATPGAAQPSASDVIESRGNWDTGDQKPKVALHVQLRTAAIKRTNDLKTIASGSPWASVPSVAGSSEGPVSDALAYAADESGRQKTVTARAAPMGSAPSRTYPPSVTASTTTVLPKSLPTSQPAPQQIVPPPVLAPSAASPVPVAAQAGDHFDDPWLRALLLAPDLQNYMTVTSFAVPDFRQLRPMMEKPQLSVRMTFSLDPQVGLATDHFSGNAVVFLSTLVFPTRTASLQ
jgi:uncharacterized protein YcbK (DUF882 family)